jgi:hypothetical protein
MTSGRKYPRDATGGPVGLAILLRQNKCKRENCLSELLLAALCGELILCHGE